MTLRHFLADDDLTPVEQREVLALAAEMKADPFRHRPFEGPRSVAILTDKPTLRTQLSFHAGVATMSSPTSSAIVNPASYKLSRKPLIC